LLDRTVETELTHWLRDDSTLHEWNPNQPRDDRGRWTDGGGGGQASQNDPSHWYLPSDKKGTWSGEKGNSTFHPHEPIVVDGKRVTGIDFKKGLPVLDTHALPGHSVNIVLTGDNKVDQANALTAWKKAHPGQQLPAETVFHHDLLHTAEGIAPIDGKGTKVLVGKMHLVPTDVHDLVYHEGSASVARKLYKGLETNPSAVKKFAEKEASVAGKEGGGFVARTAKKIIPHKIAKSALPFIGRNVLRVLPIAGAGLAIFEFSDNVEAHGIGGAVARALPVLGDLISAHDLGTELARQIRDDADAASDSSNQAINGPVSDAWDKASQQTIDAFNELAPHIEVTNPYNPDGRVDPADVEYALKIYRGAMQSANLLKAQGRKDFDFDSAAARAKQELKERLTRACQKRAPQKPSPAY
jgi:hypothetical protein